MKFLIAGLGNVGFEYEGTRHNVGFDVVNALARSLAVDWMPERKAHLAEARLKGKTLLLIKPTTYMNLSGEAVRYWMTQAKINLQNVLIIADDLALPFGTLRLKPSGGAAGHNGISHLIETFATDEFARLRFGIGSDFAKGRQVDFVLGKWTPEEQVALPERLQRAEEMVKSFVLQGIQATMNQYNRA